MVTNSSSGTSSVPLVVCSDQAGPVHSQDAISDPQSAVGGSGSVRDQSPDVNAWSVERSVLQEGQVLQYVQLCVCVCVHYSAEHTNTFIYIILFLNSWQAFS